MYEHMKYGVQLLVHLCLLFNAMIVHSFVPAYSCFGLIVPLLKDKHGDTSRSDVCRTCIVALQCLVQFLNCLKLFL